MIAHLVSSGIGVLGICDGDFVETSNLQRQIIYGEKDVGRKKVDVAEEFCRARNGKCDVKTFRGRHDETHFD